MNARKIPLRSIPAVLAWLLVALLPHASQVAAQNAGLSKLIIRVLNAKDSKGQVAIALYQGAQGFPFDKTKALRTVQIPIDPKTMSAQVSVTNLPYGAYAIAAFHDENMNGRLDKNMLGIPKEGYGFSNTSKRSMGPPKFEDAEFAINQPEQTVEIKLLY